MEELKNICSNLSPDTTSSYILWKKERARLTSILKSKLITFSEESLTQLSEYWDQECKTPGSTNEEILRKLLLISLNFYFFRNLDAFNIYFPGFMQFLIEGGRPLVITAVIETLLFVTEISKEGTLLFARIFQQLEDWMANGNKEEHWLSIVFTLKKARKGVKARFSQFMRDHWEQMIWICFEADGDVQRIALKIVSIQVKEIDATVNSDMLQKLKEKCVNVILSREKSSRVDAAMKLLIILFESHRDVIQINFAEIYDCFQKRGSFAELRERESLWYMITALDPNPKVDFDELLEQIMSYQTPLVEEVIKKRKERLNFQVIIDYIYKVVDSGKFECKSYCWFQLMKTALAEVPKLKVDPTRFEQLVPCCQHLTECIVSNKYMLIDKFRRYFSEVLLNFHEHTDDEIYNALKIARVFEDENIASGETVTKLQSWIGKASKKVRLEWLNALELIKNNDARNEILIGVGLGDKDKEVRLSAVKKLVLNVRLSHTSSFFEILSDSSFRIRRRLLKNIDVVYQHNPVETGAACYILMEQSIRVMTANPNSTDAAKAATLIRKFAPHCGKCQVNHKNFGNDIIKVCIDLLSTRSEHPLKIETEIGSDAYHSSSSATFPESMASGSFGSVVSATSDDSTPRESLRFMDSDDSDIMIPAGKNQSYTKVSVSTAQTVTCPRQTQIYELCCLEATEKRDTNLIMALGRLGKLCEPHLTPVLKVFTLQFEVEKSPKYHAVVARSLSELASHVFDGLNIRLRCPEIMQPLYGILSRTKDNELASEIMKLFGNAFDSIECTDHDSYEAYPSRNITSEMYTAFTLATVLKYMGDVKIMALKAITIIVENDPSNSSWFAHRLIPIYLNAIENFPPSLKPTVFEYFIILCESLKQDIIPFFPAIATVLERYIDCDVCLRACAAISFSASVKFAPYCGNIYNLVLRQLGTDNPKLFWESIRFCGFAVMHQGCSMDRFLAALERLDRIDEYCQRKIVKVLSMIVQNTEVRGYLSRIGIVVSKISSATENLAKSLVLYQNMSLSSAKYLFSDLDFSDVEQFLEQEIKIPQHAKFITVVNCDLKIKNLSVPFTPRNAFFKDFHYPKEVKTKKFLERIELEIIENSPLATIRSCTELCKYNRGILQHISPVAFLAAWNSTSDDDREHFSKIINRIIHEHSRVDNTVLDLIQLLDRNLVPFNIDLVRVAKISHIRPFSFYLLHRQYINGDTSVLPMLMETVQQMNKIETLKVYSNSYTQLTHTICPKYMGYVGDWEGALAQFRKENAPLSDIVSCLEHLKRYDDIIDLEAEYNAMEDSDEKVAVTSSFLWAAFLYRENAKIDRALQKVGKTISFKLYYFMIVYMISIKEYDRAQEYLDEAFDKLAKARLDYATGDRYQLHKKLAYAQLFHECQEALDYKSSLNKSTEDISDIWMHRIKYFIRDETAWERLIVLRNLVLPIHSNLQLYLKMVAALRKGEHYRLIDQYFGKHFDYITNGEAVIERLKLTWVRGEREVCLTACRVGIELLQATTQREWYKSMCEEDQLFPFVTFNTYSQQPAFTSDLKDYTAQYFDTSSMTNAVTLLQTLRQELQTKFLRDLIQQFPGQMYQCFASLMNSPVYGNEYYYGINHLYAKFLSQTNRNSFHTFQTAAKHFKCALSYHPDSYKSWCGWAFANLQMYNILTENPDARNQVLGSALGPDDEQKGSDLLGQGALTLCQSEVKEARMWDEMYCLEFPSSQGQPPPGSTDSMSANESSTLEPVMRWELEAARTKLTWNHHVDNISDIFEYGVNAVIGYLKAISLKPADAIQHMCQMFSVLFTLDPQTKITDEVAEQIVEMPTCHLLKMLPQITAQLNHPNTIVRNIAHRLLCNVSKTNFQDVYFPLNLCAHDGCEAAVTVLNNLKTSYPDVADDADLFFDGMVRSACTWFESWKTALDNIFTQTDPVPTEAKLKEIIANKYKEFRQPQCDVDQYFISLYGEHISKCIELFEKGSPFALKEMWTNLKLLHSDLKDRVSHLCSLLLTKVSEPLARKRGFHLAFVVDGQPSYLDYIEPVMEVLSTQQHPRCFYVVTRNGKRVKHLLKANEDLRLDERFMQFFTLVNNLMNGSRSNLNVSIAIYPIIPLTKEAGIIRWVTGADTLHQLVVEDRKLRQVSITKEHAMCKEITGTEFKHLNALQRFEVFEEIKGECRSMELFELMWLKSPNASMWVQRTERFTTSTALMSMVGYIIGLGDRHPGNIMIQRTTGNIVHIDFGESFESTLARRDYPEKVPFRLTRVIVNALEGSTVDGLYQSTCASIMHQLRRHRVTLSAQLAIFLQEPLDLAISEFFHSNKMILDRVVMKLEGREFSVDRKDIAVEAQVHKLIQTAANPANYIRHYPGWCPFW